MRHARHPDVQVLQGFNEAAGTDPADAVARSVTGATMGCFNEAAGTDPADANDEGQPWSQGCKLQ